VTPPNSSTILEAYEAATPQVYWEGRVADVETPISAMLKLATDEPYSFLLESVEGGKIRGRYSFIGLNPDLIWRCFDEKAEVCRSPHRDKPMIFEPCDEDSLNSLRSLLEESEIKMPSGMPPMAAGLVGYMSYDMVRLMEHLPDNNSDPLGLPSGIFVRPTVIAVFDNIDDTITVVTPIRPTANLSGKDALKEAKARVALIWQNLAAPSHPPRIPSRNQEACEFTANMSKTDFCKMVKRAQEYIRAGDAFQVVVSQRFKSSFDLPPIELYRALRRLNPSPYLFLLNFVNFSVVGSSPEILVRLRDDTVTIRPIAGTRPRGKSPAEDKALKDDLLSDPKELAEHLMLLDLGRNDVGRVSKTGSVSVTEKFTVEYYSHVMHIVSNVIGIIKKEYDALSALVAGFPAGTVSGAPKIRAMEIIDELEKEKRGIYAGCIGYFGADGDMDTCIALRTAVVKDGTVYVQAGGGVVADSDPELEYQESCNKAQAIIRAVQAAKNINHSV